MADKLQKEVTDGSLEVTKEERRLMLHALGISDYESPKKRAYRNHFFTSEGGEDFTIWESLAARGFAKVDISCRPLGRFFQVTPEGMKQLGSKSLKRIPLDMKEPEPESSNYDDPDDYPVLVRRAARLLANEIFERDEFTCVYCGAKENLSLDHVRPVSRGGGNSVQNLVTACRSCNSSKGAKPLEDWSVR